MAWRNEDALAGTRNRDGRGELRRIASLDHHRDLDRTQRRNIGNSRTGNAAKEHTGNNIYMRQSATEPADQHIGEGQQTVSDTTDAHDLTSQDEERNGHQRKAVDGLTHLLNQRHERHVHIKHREGCRTSQCKGYWEPADNK